jgi:hypothetical protein
VLNLGFRALEIRSVPVSEVFLAHNTQILRLARSCQQNKEARTAWGQFLTEFMWEWFATLTFRKSICPELAWRRCRAFLDEIQNASNCHLGWFAVEGRGVLGRFHLHALLVGCAHLRPREWERAWFRQAGTAQIVEYDNRLGGAHYCAKHLDRAGLEYHFSDNLSAFRKPIELTGNRKIDDIRPNAVVCRNDNRDCLSPQGATLPHPAVHKGGTSGTTGPSCEEAEADVEGKKHDEKDYDDKEKDQVTRNSNPSTRWRDSSGGKSMRRIARATVAREMAERDKQLRAQWDETKRARGAARKQMIRFGHLCDEARELELHKYVRKPDSRKGYVSFDEYIHDVTEGQVSKSKLYQSIDLYRLTQGSNALTQEDVAEMPIQNACLLRRLGPERRTPDIVEAAKKTSKREFPAKVQAKLNEYLPLEQQKMPRVDFFRKLHPTVAQKLEQTIERFTHLPVVRDGDRGLTLQEKAIYTICNAAEQFASEDLAAEEHCQQREAEVPELLEARSCEDQGVHRVY